MHVVTREKEEPFLEADEYAGFQGLTDRVMGGQDSSRGCMLEARLEEYVNGDNDLPVCTNMDSDTWNETFLSNLTEDINDEDEAENDEEVPEEQIDEPPPPRKPSSHWRRVYRKKGVHGGSNGYRLKGRCNG